MILKKRGYGCEAQSKLMKNILHQIDIDYHIIQKWKIIFNIYCWFLKRENIFTRAPLAKETYYLFTQSFTT